MINVSGFLRVHLARDQEDALLVFGGCASLCWWCLCKASISALLAV